MWEIPRPGIKPLSPALAGGLNHCATREAPGFFLNKELMHLWFSWILILAAKHIREAVRCDLLTVSVCDAPSMVAIITMAWVHVLRVYAVAYSHGYLRMDDGCVKYTYT